LKTSANTKLSNNNDINNVSIYTILIPAYLPLIGSWIGGFAIPLDWDVPWKYWPISNIYGHIGGILLGQLLLLLFF